MQLRKLPAAVAAALAMSPHAHAALEETASTLSDQQSMAVTIYNENLALVKDTRRVSLQPGVNRLALPEVSAPMRPETPRLPSPPHPQPPSLADQNSDSPLFT